GDRCGEGSPDRAAGSAAADAAVDVHEGQLPAARLHISVAAEILNGDRATRSARVDPTAAARGLDRAAAGRYVERPVAALHVHITAARAAVERAAQLPEKQFPATCVGFDRADQVARADAAA